jgi:phosphonate transport system substrate-binding protein
MRQGYFPQLIRYLGILAIGLALSPLLRADESILIGVVPQFEARKLHQIWQPIIDELSTRTGKKFELSGSPTIVDFERQLLEGKFDFAYMNPYHFIMAQQAQGYNPVVRDTSRKLSGILVVKNDSGIDSPKQLDGKTLAFPAPNALGASLQMRQELTDLFGITFTPNYVKTHDSVYLNVMFNKAAAGGGVGKTLQQQKDSVKNALKVIHKTKPVAPHPVAAHPRVAQALVDSVRETFLQMSNSDEGKALLEQIPMRVAGASTAADYEELISMKLERFYVQPE